MDTFKMDAIVLSQTIANAPSSPFATGDDAGWMQDIIEEELRAINTVSRSQTDHLMKLALDLISLGARTRVLQKAYYKTKNQSNLVAAKQAEREFDDLLIRSKMDLESIQAEIEGKHFQAELPIEEAAE